MPGTIKDIIPRYKAMRGFKVERRFGWDCHGLPVENLIEKELGLDSKTDIERYGVAKFNEACRASVLRYVKEWRTIMTRAGRWVDFDNDYKTMDPDYMESIWWVMKSLWDKGLVYEGHYILPYCPRCSTVLSNHELALGGYKDVHDPAITLKFKVKVAAPAGLSRDSPTAAPISSPGRRRPGPSPPTSALCLGPDIDYVLVKDGPGGPRPERYILAESRLRRVLQRDAMPEIVWRKKGSELRRHRVRAPLPLLRASCASRMPSAPDRRHVTTEDGTGIVHTAPGFGEEDHEVLKGTGVPTVCPIDAECKFTAEVPDYAGRFVKDCDKDIMDRLKAEGKLVRREQILHAYPHCWRCAHPLIYRAIGSWFVKIEPVKPKMLAANSKVYWVPEHIKDGSASASGSRAPATGPSRAAATGAIPCRSGSARDCGKTICVGSRAELQKLSGVHARRDLHKHFVDEVTIPCEGCGGTLCGASPRSSTAGSSRAPCPTPRSTTPSRTRSTSREHFPADFISESLDQTRGWFYSLTVLAAALFDRPAFQNCVVSGMVLAADGKKMSKSPASNYTDPDGGHRQVRRRRAQALPHELGRDSRPTTSASPTRA